MSILGQIGYSGVRASQIALSATGQNIANVNTPGFSRLAPDLHSLGGQTSVSVGGGVQVSSIRRLSNDFQNQQLWRASTDKNYFNTNQQYLTALEGLIDSEGSSVSVGLDNFFAALSEASSTPESIALRQQIIGEAKQLAQRFNGLNSNIGTQLNALQGQRVAMTSEINGLSGNIAELNAQIREMESSGRDTATLRDYRDNLVKDLSQYAGIRVQEAADGTLNVSLANGQPLVAGATAGQLKINANLAGEQEMTLVFAKTTFPLNQQGIGGSLGGLYDMEYGALRPAQRDLHDMASAVATMVNDALSGGFDLNGNPGQPLFSYNAGSTSGMLAVNALGASELAFSGTAGEVGNNKTLLTMLELKSAGVTVAGETVPLNDAYAGLVGRVASASRQNQADLRAATTVAEQAQAQRDSVSAVNLDEEAVNLMAYEQAYQANMKVISTSNDLFNAVLAMF
ncbi:flagellar hook-associated protein FlgK [Stutzerimonas xanthomarina]|uniref:Flagellar hook-associated protein 1 n=2 Tax=Stutzerimonas xanthomarina TaxID=271420 RepID=A0A1M5TKW5_9GAMM|nr:flagellar hook-associated protein FlgK [Stutzerimonas xanthomarina]MCP9339982.1 flagellar hook-associated protein FlgK [Stutzerimonas xanthomarina]SEH55747.1 flagellar hook-associated protein 1 FlgK [Stutzerimonas xanthomarina]SHH51321.1 flagellar hook-associated protein 1 FlgK [Stutzerimonas xanthomarina DSM 18231]